MLKTIAIAALLLGMCGQAPATETRSSGPSLKDLAGRDVVGVAAGGRNGALVDDMAALIGAPDLQVVQVVSEGPLQSLADLLYKKGVDAAVLQADVLPYVREHHLTAGDEPRVAAVGTLYREDVHVLARAEVPDIAALSGKRVNLGPRWSGSALTGARIFEALGITIQPTFFPQDEALRRMRAGDLAALVETAAKPAPLFRNLSRQRDGVHFLPLTGALPALYRGAQLGIEDYPLLIGEGEAGRGAPIATLSVPVMLAVYDFAPGSPRHARVARFVDALTRHAAALAAPGRDPLWREMDLAAVVPGWPQFVPAALASRRETSGSGSSASAAHPPARTPENDTLFRQFLQWQAIRGAQP